MGYLTHRVIMEVLVSVKSMYHQLYMFQALYSTIPNHITTTRQRNVTRLKLDAGR